MTTDTAGTVKTPTEKSKRNRKPSMRSVLLAALKTGETDSTKLVAIAKQFDPEWDERRIKASLAVHKGYLKKQRAQVPLAQSVAAL